jgi:sugar phosphate isomerase/epimerase
MPVPISADRSDRVLWSFTTGVDSTIAERIDAAHACDCGRFSVSYLDITAAMASGDSLSELSRRIRDADLEVIVDPLMNWYRDADPDAQIPYAAVSAEQSLRLCEQLPITSMTAVADLSAFAGYADPEQVPLDDLVDSFARLCDQAAEVGARIHLEFLPCTAAPDVNTASEIVNRSGRENGGIVFDTWHFFQGNPDFEALRSVSGHRIFAVQLSDAPAIGSGSLIEDSMNRLLPGDGSFDLVRALRVLADIDGLHGVGAEVISPDLAALGPVQAAVVANERAHEVIARATAGESR